MNEMELLQDAFGFDETPSAAARDRARTALLDRINGVESTAPRRRAPGARWALRATAVVTAAAAVTVGVMVVVTGGPAERAGRSDDPPAAVAAPPFAKPAGAAEFLENAAWAASRRPWVPPRPDQFMYIEATYTENRDGGEPNGALVPGRTTQRRGERWWRVDFQVFGSRDNGGAVTTDVRTDKQHVAGVPYADLVGLDTPEKFEAWHTAPGKRVEMSPWAVLMTYVLPPAVEAAIFRWLSRQPGVRIDPDSVNLDGRPAIALTFEIENYLQHDMLFDPRSYALIGDRLVAYADHTATALDGTWHIKAGDVFRLEILGRRGIVDEVGDTP